MIVATLLAAFSDPHLSNLHGSIRPKTFFSRGSGSLVDLEVQVVQGDPGCLVHP
jgi:hypothetical protein